MKTVNSEFSNGAAALAALVVSVLAAFGAEAAVYEYAENTTVSAPLVLTEDSTISVASGVTVTYDAAAAISGAFKITKAGAGKLVLQGVNSFSSLQVSEGTVCADVEGALGSGLVSLGASGVKGYLQFNAEGGSFPNNVRSDVSSSGIAFLKSTILTGNISGSNYLEMKSSAGTVNYLRGTVGLSSSKDIYLAGNAGDIVIEGDLAFKGATDNRPGGFYENNNNITGRIIFNNEGKAVGGNMSILLSSGEWVCNNPNAVPDARFNYNKTTASPGSFDLNGFNQTIGYFLTNSGYTPSHDTASLCFTSPTSADLIVNGHNGGTSSTCNFAFNGAVNFVLDADPAFTNRVCKRRHLTTGSITIKSGVFEIGDGEVTFENVESVIVQSNGTLRASTAFGNAFAGIQSLVLEEGSSIILDENDVASIPSITYAGRPLKVRRYTSAECPAIKSGTLAATLAPVVDVVWTGIGADERVTDPDNWDMPGLEVDNSKLQAVFAGGGAAAIFDADVIFKSVSLTSLDFSFLAGGGRMLMETDNIEFQSGSDPDPHEYVFEAPMELTGDLTMAAPAKARLVLSNLVTTAASGTVPGTLSFDVSAANAYACLHDVDIAQSLTYRPAGGLCTMKVDAGTTNVIHGKFTVADVSSPYYCIDTGAQLTVEGGVDLKNGAYLRGYGTLIVTNRAMTCNSKKACWVGTSAVDSGCPTLVFAAPNNTCPLMVSDYGGHIVFAVDRAFDGGASTSFSLSSRWDGTSTAEFAPCATQTFAKVNIGGSYPARVTVNGASGAVMRINGAQDSSILGKIDAKLRVRGALIVENAGSGTLTLGHVDADGDLGVRLGANAKVKVPDGVVQEVSSLCINGAPVPPGLYTYETAPEGIKPYFDSAATGQLKVKYNGMMILFY